MMPTTGISRRRFCTNHRRKHMMSLMPIFFQLLIGHALADFVLQPDAMGYGKNRNSDAQKTKGELFPHWYYWMTAHALVHGGVVYIVSGSAVLGLIETGLHWAIDFGKCEGWYNIHIDQGLHIACKLVYCGLIYIGMFGLGSLIP